MADDSITAVIPVHNRADLLARLLGTLRTQTSPLAEVLVVDNASTDDAAQVAREAGCRVIEMGENLGFARAVNRGWRAASTPWIALLNSDVELDNHWLERLLAGVESNCFATGTILSAGDRSTIDGTYDLMSRGACAWRAGNGTPLANPGTAQKIAIAPATACLFRRGVLERLGGFDESFGSYLEDVDLGLRCLRAGFPGVYVPDALAWHHGSATWGRWSPQVVRAISRNQVLLVAHHYDRALFQSCFWPIVAGQLLWGLLALRHGAGFAWAAGKWEGLRHFRPQGSDSAPLRDFLAASEREIRDRARGPYWRWYFRLVASSAPDSGTTAAH
ncbi:MAG: glycosyltransferase family 2 protein [Bryobacteraceae bacterium]|jgi:GT2 family glycosyltransferase